MYEESLKELGLTDNEVKIYLLLLKEGMMNPSEIAQKLGIHRGYTYDALERMQEKEVVNSVLQKNKKYFQANKPENLLESLRLRLENFQKIVPDLSQMINIGKEDTCVELHKGEKVYRTLLKDIISVIKKNEEILIIGVDEEVLSGEVEPIYLEQYLNTIKTKNIKEKIIIKKGKRRLKFKSLKYKQIEEKYIGNAYQIIYSDKVALFILGNPYYLIVIENKEVVNTYKKQFELMWKIAK